MGAQTNGGEFSAINTINLLAVLVSSKIAIPSYIYPDCANPNCDWGKIDKSVPTTGMYHQS